MPHSRPPGTTGSVDIMAGRMGALSPASKDMKIVQFREYVVCAMHGFGSFATARGEGFYGSDLEATLRRQPPSHSASFDRKGIRAPITNRITKARPALDWGFEYGSVPGNGALVLNDAAPLRETKLEDLLTSNKDGDKGNHPASIYPEQASMRQRNNITDSMGRFPYPNIFGGGGRSPLNPYGH